MIRLKTFITFTLLCLAGKAIADDDNELDGLWAAYKRFGPQVEGPLIIDPGLERAEAGAYITRVDRDGEKLTFELPGGEGAFIANRGDESIRGHWIQPAPMQVGLKMASPVQLRPLKSGWWQGEIRPRASEYTFFLPVRATADGEITAFLRNPDRNLGIFTRIQRIEQDQGRLSFIGTFFRNPDPRVMANGSYDPEFDVLRMELLPWRGGTYDFRRVPADERTAFDARPQLKSPWSYSPPPSLNDGWETSTLKEAGIAEEPIRRMIENEIITPDDNIHSHRVHAVLIARNGKLVLEEYFHGFDRNTPHDTRSASKSVASMLVGAAMQAGYAIGEDTPVYQTLRGTDEGLEPRKQAMKLRHLLTMSSGLYCDDSDADAPGNEDAMQEQTDQPDWYAYTLDLPMSDDPGARPIYCSANSNLIGAVLSAATGKSLLDLFADLVARPMGIERYYLGLQPTGEPYFGGGSHWLPRDFMKIGQVMLNGGTWKGQRMMSERWAAESIRTQVNLRDRSYGYQWWINEYPWGDTTVQAFFAAGNGGQIVMGVPKLNLLIAFFGGNYSDAVLYRAQNVLIPEYILKATN